MIIQATDRQYILINGSLRVHSYTSGKSEIYTPKPVKPNKY